MFSFEGMMAPTFAPFNQDGSLNLEVIPEYADHLVGQGVKGIYVNGTSGEGLSMTSEERKSLTAAWALEAKKKSLKMIVMISSGCLKDTIELALHAKTVEASGIAVLPPLFDRPKTVEDLVDYCKEVADAVPDLPLFYYHVPFKTEVNLPMDAFLEIASKSISSLGGMKFTSEDVAGEGLRCLRFQNGKYTIFAGFDQTLDESVGLGYRCAINMCFNFLGKEAQRILDPANRIEGGEAKKSQQRINEVLATIFSYSGGAFSISAGKAAMEILSAIRLGPTRKPCKNIAQVAHEAMKAELPKSYSDILNKYK